MADEMVVFGQEPAEEHATLASRPVKDDRQLSTCRVGMLPMLPTDGVSCTKSTPVVSRRRRCPLNVTGLLQTRVGLWPRRAEIQYAVRLWMHGSARCDRFAIDSTLFFRSHGESGYDTRFARRGYTSFGLHTMGRWPSFVVVDSCFLRFGSRRLSPSVFFTYIRTVCGRNRVFLFFVFDPLGFSRDNNLAGIVHSFPPIRTRHAMVKFSTTVGRLGGVVRLRSLTNFRRRVFTLLFEKWRYSSEFVYIAVE